MAIDENRRPGQFVLTGSSDLLRVKGTPDSLAGRAVTVELHPFSQGELVGRPDDFVARMLGGVLAADITTATAREDLIRLVVTGGYPEVQTLSNRMRSLWFDSYVDRIIRRDAEDVRGRVDHGRLQSLLRLTAANQAGETVTARFAADASIPVRSVPSYLDLLGALYLTAQLRPWTPNLTSREAARPKSFVRDGGLAAWLTGATADRLAAPEGSSHLGQLVEGFVVSELMRQRTWSGHEYDLFHWRDRNGLEVDVIVELAGGSVLGVEVKATSTLKGDHFKGLKALRDRLGDRFVCGVVLSMDPRGISFGDRLMGLPISSLWEL